MNLYEVSPPDPGCPPCGEHKWEEERYGDIYWRMCDDCSLTECSVPGLDRCFHLAMESMPHDEFFALDLLGRLRVSARGERCHRLTEQRCSRCDLAFCSDHLADHLGWCGRTGTKAVC